MDLSAIATPEFCVRFAVEGESRGFIAYDSLHMAIAAALRLGPGVTPKYTSVCAGTARSVRTGEPCEGFARVNGVRGVTVDGRKVAMISYSFYLTRHGALVLHSSDLDKAAHPAHRKANEVWFRRDEQPVLLTDELRAAVGAIAPKKTRAASPRV